MRETALVDLGDPYLSNFFDVVTPDAPRGRLQLGLGADSGILKLLDATPSDVLYRRYWYLSGTNATMTRQLKDIVDVIPRWVRLDDGDHVLDIGCNDGTLLKHYPTEPHLVRVGIDPAENLEPLGKQACDLHACDYFGKDVYLGLTHGKKAKVITSIAMFYDLADPHAFVHDIGECLADNGVWILQLSYTPLMLKQNAFDNVVHEHLCYYSLTTIDRLFKQHDMKIVSVEFNDTNAGSFRLVVMRDVQHRHSAAALFDRDIAEYQYDAILAYEDRIGVNRPEAVVEFGKRLEELKARTLDLLITLKNQGKTVYGYGASTKGNTLLQYYEIDPSLIPAIAERQAQKVGKLTAGSWIPIVSEAEMRAATPDYLFVLPWHFIHEFTRRESAFLQNGGKLIVPLPDLQVIGG